MSLPIHRHPPRSSRRSCLPRSRFTTFIVLALGSLTLYFFYHLTAPPPEPWGLPDHPPPPPLHHPGRPPPPHPLDDTFFGSPNEIGPETEQHFSEEQLLWKSRAESVKQSFLHAWDSYEEHAWGADEVRPLSGVGVQKCDLSWIPPPICF